MSVDLIRIERERAEAQAAKRAKTLKPGDYHANGNFVAKHEDGAIVHVIECESHWDACLVLLALWKVDA